MLFYYVVIQFKIVCRKQNVVFFSLFQPDDTKPTHKTLIAAVHIFTNVHKCYTLVFIYLIVDGKCLYVGGVNIKYDLIISLQQNTKIEMKAVKKNLENTECELEKHEDECSKLRLSVDSEHQTNSSLRQVITNLEKDLDEEKRNSLNVQRTLTRVTAEKNTALLRNAEISQQMEIAKQETRRQESEMNDLLNKINQLEDDNNKYKEKETKGVEQELRNTVTILEEQLADKNKVFI